VHLADRDRPQDVEADPRGLPVRDAAGALDLASEQRRGRTGVLVVRVPGAAGEAGGGEAPLADRLVEMSRQLGQGGGSLAADTGARD
jgi:hypothetical protein